MIGAKAKAIRGLKAISITKNTFNREEIKEKYGQIGEVENKNDGRKVTFYKGIFGKMYKEGGLFTQITPQLKELFENSILAYSEIDNLAGTQRADGTIHKEHRNISSYDNYVAKAQIDNKEYYVRFTVQNETDGRRGNHSLMVTNVSLYENTINVASTSAKLGERLDIDSIIDAKLQQFFESARKSEENSSKIVDENGVLKKRKNAVYYYVKVLFVFNSGFGPNLYILHHTLVFLSLLPSPLGNGHR